MQKIERAVLAQSNIAGGASKGTANTSSSTSSVVINFSLSGA